MNQEINQQKEIKIGSLGIAQKKVIQELTSCGFELKDIISINRNRYSILTSHKKNILLTFKRDPFFTFGKMFKDLGHEDGELGDTINREELETAIKMQVTDIISVFADGTAYTIPLYGFMEKSVKWTLGEGKEVRSISLKEYKKIFDLE